MQIIRKASLLRSNVNGLTHAVIGAETNGRGAGRYFIERAGQRVFESDMMNEREAIRRYDARVITEVK